MIEALRQWLEDRHSRLTQSGVSVQVSSPTHGLSKNSIHADLKTDRYECTVQLWDSGESDFHLMDWEATDEGVSVTHHHFNGKQDLYAALDALLKGLSSETGDSETLASGQTAPAS
jgi:hypothetical protein